MQILINPNPEVLKILSRLNPEVHMLHLPAYLQRLMCISTRQHPGMLPVLSSAPTFTHVSASALKDAPSWPSSLCCSASPLMHAVPSTGQAEHTCVWYQKCAVCIHLCSNTDCLCFNTCIVYMHDMSILLCVCDVVQAVSGMSPWQCLTALRRCCPQARGLSWSCGPQQRPAGAVGHTWLSCQHLFELMHCNCVWNCGQQTHQQMAVFAWTSSGSPAVQPHWQELFNFSELVKSF